MTDVMVWPAGMGVLRGPLGYTFGRSAPLLELPPRSKSTPALRLTSTSLPKKSWSVAPAPAGVVTSVTLTGLAGFTEYDPGRASSTPVMAKDRLKVAPEAAGVVVSVTLTGLAGLAVYAPPLRTTAPFTAPPRPT